MAAEFGTAMSNQLFVAIVGTIIVVLVTALFIQHLTECLPKGDPRMYCFGPKPRGGMPPFIP
jgi:hypothetical protein